jgi:hypothetical protein
MQQLLNGFDWQFKNGFSASIKPRIFEAEKNNGSSFKLFQSLNA